jgi:co-chaperonin GroES (HSP10)
MVRIMPIGNRLLVQRKRVGEKIGKAGLILTTDHTKDAPTDMAIVKYIPEMSFADKSLVKNAEKIVDGLAKKASDGDAEALKALLDYNRFLKIKSIKVGDTILMGKFVGTDCQDSGGEYFTLVDGDDIIGVVVNE